jgi:predicted DNA-binding transcriptional regulator AlpA
MTIDKLISNANKLPRTGLVRFPQFQSLISLSTVTVWRMVNDGRFPKPFRVSPKLRLWRAEDIHEWLSCGPEEWRSRHAAEAAPAV